MCSTFWPHAGQKGGRTLWSFSWKISKWSKPFLLSGVGEGSDWYFGPSVGSALHSCVTQEGMFKSWKLCVNEQCVGAHVILNESLVNMIHHHQLLLHRVHALVPPRSQPHLFIHVSQQSTAHAQIPPPPPHHVIFCSFIHLVDLNVVISDPSARCHHCFMSSPLIMPPCVCPAVAVMDAWHLVQRRDNLFS